MDNLYRRGSFLNVPRLQSAGVEFIDGDVRALSAFPTGPFDFLIECSAEPSVTAGQSGETDYVFHTNLIGAYNCLEKAREWQSRVIFLSTSRVYPIATLEAHPWHEEADRFVWEDVDSTGIGPDGVTEALPMKGARSLYGFTKYAAELLIEEYRKAYGLQAVINRCGVIAGPWQFGKTDQGILAFWVLAHHLNKQLRYIGYGGLGKQVRDFLHVDDLCRLICEQMEDFSGWEGWLGNVSGGKENSVSLRNLTSLCQRILGRSVPVSADLDQRPMDLRIYTGDCSQLFSRTAWRPRKTVTDIVEDTAQWVSEHETQLALLWQ
jgi:CDP-paratose 2-epimerase